MIEKKGYRWSGGPAIGVPAEEAARLFEELRNRDGELTVEAVVDAARPEDALLHDAFTWDNDVAAERYRHGQARGLIGRLRVVYVAPDRVTEADTRAYVSRYVLERSGDTEGSPTDEAHHKFKDVATVMEDPELRQRYIRVALAQIRSWRQTHRALDELADIFDAVDATLVQYGLAQALPA